MEGFDLYNNDPETALSIIREFGFVRLPGFVQGESLEALTATFELAIRDDNYKYGYGKMSRFSDLPGELHPAASFFASPFFQHIITGFWAPDTAITQEYSFIHDFKYDAATIYGHLHFDRRHQLKFMLYLTDVQSKDHGAFCAIPQSNKMGISLYTRSWKEALSLETSDFREVEEIARTILDADLRYKSLSFRMDDKKIAPAETELANVKPITGLAGTVVIFDTHVLHSGGLVTEGFERKTLRLHSFPA